jgi:predicted transcriptional regulator of viral defense system
MVSMSKAGSDTGLFVHYSTQAPIDLGIAELAAHQHAVFTLDQLEALGLSRTAAYKRAARGRFHRIHPGVYSLIPANLLTRESRWMAAALAPGPGAVVSHRTAAALHELLPTARSNIDVTVPGRGKWTYTGLDIHRSTTLTDADVTIVNEIPCTTISRTLFDLADVVDRRRHERAFDQADVLEVIDLAQIEDQLLRNPTRPAAGRVRKLLEEHYIGSTPTESELEEAFLALCRRAGLPRPEVQAWIYLPDGGPALRVDFLWRRRRVVVETDGARYHGTGQASRRDTRRDQRLMVHGYKPIRTGWRQINYEPSELEATLKALVLGRG